MSRMGIWFFIFGFSAVFGNTFNVSTVSEFRSALEDAGFNDENNIIVLDAGVYKTTEDGRGTFSYVGTKESNLTIKAKDGLSYENVLLDGNNSTASVLKFDDTEEFNNIVYSLESLTITGSNGDSGVVSDHSMIINDCNISNNTTPNYGGGIRISLHYSLDDQKLIIKDSIISYNTASYDGGGFKSDDTDIYTIIENSLISYNKARTGGGFLVNHLHLKNSEIIYNQTTYNQGGGFSCHQFIIENTKITNNYSHSYGGAFYGVGGFLVNSKILDNTAQNNSGGVHMGNPATTINTIFSNNSIVGLGAANGTDNDQLIINSTFTNHNDIAFAGAGLLLNNLFYENTSEMNLNDISKVFHNYYDITKVSGTDPIKRRNIYAQNGDIVINQDFTLPSNSLVINQGLNPSDELFISSIDDYYHSSYPYSSEEEIQKMITLTYDYLKTDILGNFRINDEIVDMGVYEYGSKKPEHPILLVPVIMYLLN